MGNLVTFAFQNNEGKYFAPIASEEPTGKWESNNKWYKRGFCFN